MPASNTRGNSRSFGRMQAHQRHPALGIVTVGVTDQRGVVEKLRQRLAPLLRILGGIGEFLQVFNAGEGFRSPFLLERADVTGTVDQKANQFRERGRISRLAEPFVGNRIDRWQAGLISASSNVSSGSGCSSGSSGSGSRSPKSKPTSSHSPESVRASGAHDSCSGATSCAELLGKSRFQQGARIFDQPAKGRERHTGACRQELFFHRLSDRCPRAHAGLDAQPVQHFQRGLADTARRRIDDSRQGDRIIRVLHQFRDS